LDGAKVAVLGAAYRGGVKETAFSGVFPTVESLRGARAHVVVHDPMYTDEELRSLGFEPYHFGEAVDAAILQADHAEYFALGEQDLPGLRAFVDGRKVTKPEAFPGAQYRVIGR